MTDEVEFNVLSSKTILYSSKVQLKIRFIYHISKSVQQVFTYCEILEYLLFSKDMFWAP